jgi:hypothetical protein
MLELVKKLTEFKRSFLDRDHELLKMAEDCGDDAMKAVAECLIQVTSCFESAIESCSKNLSEEEKKSMNETEAEKSAPVTEHDLEALAALAEEFSKSEDEFLKRQASVLDQVLMTFAIPESKQEHKKAYEDKLLEIKNRLQNKSNVKEAFKADEVAKVVDDNIKEYKPLETALKTRTCPDHPGAQMQRLSDDVYQCSLDKKTYDFKSGFTTMKGNKVPGGDVTLQTQFDNTRTMSFHSK